MTGTNGADPIAQLVELLRQTERARQPTPEPATDEPGEGTNRNTAGLLLADNRALVAPYGWITAADIVAFTAHYPAHLLGWWGPVATVAAACAAVAARTLWHVRSGRLERVVKTAKTRQKIVRDARIALAAGTLWEFLATLWTPIGPHAFMQALLVGGGMAVAAPHLWRNRHRPAEPVPELEAPREDPRLAAFREQYCQSGTLRDALLYAFETVTGGFAFEVECSIAHRGTFQDVKNLEPAIAAFYDVPPDHVSVEPPKTRSNRRARITVLTEPDAHEREDRWDGESTYNPKTGCFRLGRYADSTSSRWQLHAPYSGAAGGLSVGVINSGKTGTLHVVACEAGQAKLCAECLTEQSCEQCNPQRIAAVWLGDPQRQPFGVYRARADLTAWGPKSCVRMLHWMHAAGRDRAARMGRMEWTDHRGRTNDSKGWFDPEPGFPLIIGIIDEWPMVTGDPELAAYAVPLAVDILSEFRKAGITLILGSQEADVDVLGERAVREALTAFNTCVHRTDQYAKQMLGVEGNPTHLAPGIPGLSYLNGIDRRSGVVQRTKTIREYARPGETGVDVREVADRIAAEPIVYDEGFLQAIRSLGYTGPGQVLSDDDGWDVTDLLPAQEDTSEPGGGSVPTGAAGDGSVHPQDVARVEHTLLQHRGDGADIYDLMQATQLSALDVSRAVDSLIATGNAAQTATGRYVSCI